MAVHAVVTGDIINFTKLASDKRQLMVEDLKKLFEIWVSQPGDAEIFRGDSYQILFDDVSIALKRSLQLICWFKKHHYDEITMDSGAQISNTKKQFFSNEKNKRFLSTRLSVGIGKVSYRGNNVLDSDGEAFHLSGRSFDKMKNGELLTINTNDPEKNTAIEIILNFVNKIINQWSAQQSEVIFLLLEGKTQQEMASKLELVQSSVNSRIKLANWKEVEMAIEYISKLVIQK